MRSRAPERLAVLLAHQRAHVYSQKQTETKSGHPSLNLSRSVSRFFFHLLYDCAHSHFVYCACERCAEGERAADAADFPPEALGRREAKK